MKLQISLVQLVSKEVKTDKKTFLIPVAESLFESPIFEVPINDDYEAFYDFCWKVNGILRPTKMQLALDRPEEE